MRRFLAAILALAMMVSFGVVAMADAPLGNIMYDVGPEGIDPNEWFDWDIHQQKYPDVNKLNPGDTIQLIVYYYDSTVSPRTYHVYTGDVQWRSDHNSIATVSDTGLVTAVKNDPTVEFVRIDAHLGNVTPGLGIYVLGGTTDPKPDDPKPDDPKPDNPKPDKPTPGPGPVVDDDDDDNESPTENESSTDKTTDALENGENVVLKLHNGSAAIHSNTMDLLGTSKGSLTIKNGGTTITIPGGFGNVTEPGRIFYSFDCGNDFPYSGNVDKTFQYGNDYSYEKAKIGANETTLPTTAKVTLNTNLTGAVEVYKYDYMRGTYKLVTTTTENQGTVTFNTKEMGDFVLVQKGKTPTPVIPGDLSAAIAEINAERTKRGLPALKMDSTLMAAAAKRASEQPISFGHTRPDGTGVNDSLPREFGIAGVWENCGTIATPGGVIAQWMDDPPHRDILLAEDPTKLGIGYCYDANSPYKNYWVFLATW